MFTTWVWGFFPRLGISWDPMVGWTVRINVLVRSVPPVLQVEWGGISIDDVTVRVIDSVSSAAFVRVLAMVDVVIPQIVPNVMDKKLECINYVFYW